MLLLLNFVLLRLLPSLYDIALGSRLRYLVYRPSIHLLACVLLLRPCEHTFI